MNHGCCDWALPAAPTEFSQKAGTARVSAECKEYGWLPTRVAVIVRALEIENDAECRIDSVHLVEAEESNALA